MNRVWKIHSAQPDLSRILAKNLNILPLTAQLLINRNIKDELHARHFLYGDLHSCHNPRLLKDIEKAVMRIKRAIKDGEKILLYGDYDVDGITSVALLYLVLRHFDANIMSYIPNRLEEGYGLNINAIEFAYRNKIGLIITADCGISAHSEIEEAKRYGIDVIVTDHHEIKTESLPGAFAIINPLQKECCYPFKYLSGVGICYKLCQVLMDKIDYPVEEHLDLVALGTVSDLSVQTGENRILTKCGLKKLMNTKKVGLKKLIEVSGLQGKVLSNVHIGYVLGPRINAMGRVSSPEIALRLLLTNDEEEAERCAEILNAENRARQRIENDVLEQAINMVERDINFKDRYVIVLSNTSWHQGVIGIVASRITERYYRPAILITIHGEIGKGSGRGIDNFHLFEAIKKCERYLVDFGGHEGACGLVIKKKNIRLFDEELNKVAQNFIDKNDLYPKLYIDAHISLSDLSERLIEELKLLAPFGPENPKPVFLSTGLSLRNPPKRIGRSGLKLWVTDENVTCEAVTYRNSLTSLPEEDSMVNLVYTPSINLWQGIRSIQLNLKDLRTERISKETDRV